ncbi:hypothetical protein AB0B28_16725 [Glycomyces sp. NPDC046736]|uniref:hypothetical protein n=1 Tax=Glycomyces sp. NPDC046736 TaxID=3155615 RepID=UPI00340C952C
MSDNQKGEVVDFSDAPKSSVYGRNADGGFINDPFGNGKKALEGNIPFYAQIKGGFDAVDKAFNPPQSYFKGEWWETLLNSIQALADLGVQIVDAFDYAKAALSFDPADIIGALAAAVCKGLLDFLWSSFQPLQDAAGVLLGNPGKIQNSAAMWGAVSENLTSLYDALGTDLGKTLTECWDSEAGCAAAVRGGDLLDTADFASQSADGLKDLLNIYADMAERINDTVRQAIADLVSFVINRAIGIAMKGPAEVIMAGIDIAILVVRYTLRFIGIAIQEAWFIIAGKQLLNTIKDCFEQAMEVLEKLAGYNTTVRV